MRDTPARCARGRDRVVFLHGPISNRGYNPFVLKYRAGQSGREDLATALAYIFRSAGALGVATADYSLWGSSAGTSAHGWIAHAVRFWTRVIDVARRNETTATGLIWGAEFRHLQNVRAWRATWRRDVAPCAVRPAFCVTPDVPATFAAVVIDAAAEARRRQIVAEPMTARARVVRHGKLLRFGKSARGATRNLSPT